MEPYISQYKNSLKKFTLNQGPRPSGKESAVLVPISFIDDTPHVLLTRRSENLSSHPGQICFPGGKPTNNDKSLLETAIRETWEELGIDSVNLDILGDLDEVYTITGFLIKPYVATVNPYTILDPNLDELTEIYWVSIEKLLDPQNYKSKSMTLIGNREYEMQIFDVTDPPVWGATARILRQLLEVLYGWQDPNPDQP